MASQERIDRWFAASLSTVICLLIGALFIPVLWWCFDGFYPGAMQSGQPGYDTTMRYSLHIIWGSVMAMLDLTLCILGRKLRSTVLLIAPFALLLASLVVAVLRFLKGIPGDF
jgi:hypothetical protein